MKTKLIYRLIFWSALICAPAIYSQSGWINRNPQPQNDFYSIKFFNLNSGYAIGSSGIILKTTTGGTQWIAQAGNTSKNLYGSYFFDMNHGIIVGDSGIVLNTTNGGNNWTQISSGTLNSLHSVTFVNSNSGLAVGNNGTVLKTTNGGLNWVISSPTAVNLSSVFFIDLNLGYAGGDNGTLLKTTNAGLNWNVNTVGTGSVKSIFFTDNLNGYISEVFSYPYKTTNGGITWNSMMSSLTGNSRCIKFVNQNTGFAVGYQGPIYRTTNQGLNWNDWCSGQLFGNYNFTDISIIDTNTFFVSGEKGWLLKSVGTYLAQNSHNIGGNKSNVSYISFVDENTGCAMGQGVFLNTTNGGTKWNVSCAGSNNWFESSSYIDQVVMFGPQSMYRIYFEPGHAGFPSFGIDRSTDNGLTWGSYNFGGIGSFLGICEIQGTAYMSDAEVYNGGLKIKKNTGSGWVDIYNSTVELGKISFANQTTGAVLSNGAPSSIIRTTNGGSNWTIIPTGTTKNIYDIQFLPSGIAYLAGDSSFMQRSTDFGATWNLLPGQNLKFYQMHFVNDNTGWMIAQTYSPPFYNKLYYTSNGGTNFIQVQSLGNFYPNGMSFINSLTGYVCGDTGIVLKTTNGGLTFVNPISNLAPSGFSLSQNYPNPFNPATNIKFELPKSGFVKLTVYDALGREVATLVNEEMKAGSYNADWDASNFASGIYFYKLEVNEFVETKKMVLIK